MNANIISVEGHGAAQVFIEDLGDNNAQVRAATVAGIVFYTSQILGDCSADEFGLVQEIVETQLESWDSTMPIGLDEYVNREIVHDWPKPKPTVQATELEWLKWFHENADFGPADIDVINYMKRKFITESDKLLPEGYADEDEDEDDEYIVVGVNNEGGHPAIIKDTLAEVREYINGLCLDCDPPFSESENLHLQSDLESLRGKYVETVRGSEAWKEYFVISPY